jgi:putative SOS response-associated peptidase YedK
MCGRYFLEASLDELDQAVGRLLSNIKLARRYNIAPQQPVPVVRDDGFGRRHLDLLRWGLVPSWSKGPDNRFSMINARAETVAEKPAYRAALRYRRCAIPASGFYEWRAAGRAPKQPFAIRHTDRSPMLFAGLWEHWMGADGSELETCCIVVTEANAALRPIHERMPVILRAEDLDLWLDRHQQHGDAVLPLLKPCDPSLLEVYPVGREVNNPQHDSAQLIEPVANEDLF